MSKWIPNKLGVGRKHDEVIDVTTILWRVVTLTCSHDKVATQSSAQPVTRGPRKDRVTMRPRRMGHHPTYHIRCTLKPSRSIGKKEERVNKSVKYMLVEGPSRALGLNFKSRGSWGNFHMRSKLKSVHIKYENSPNWVSIEHRMDAPQHRITVRQDHVYICQIENAT